MKWIETKVFIDSDDPFRCMEMISDIFRDLCTQGIVVEDPYSQPHEGWGHEAQKPPDYFAVTGYFPENLQGDHKRQLLEKKILELKEHCNFSTRIVYQRIDDQDWANSWKKYFKPQKIGEKIVVKPSWHAYKPKPGEMVLEIDPGMAFGTGTHPTTAMCIRLLERYLKKDDSFLDIGTGSGILMIAAHQLGANRLVGIDRDETAATVARDNLLLNGVSPGKYHLIVTDLIDALRGKFRVVAANILSEVIVLLLDRLPNLLEPEGIFIASGIIEDNREMVIRKMCENRLNVIASEIQEQWVAIAAQNNNLKSIH